MICENLSVYNSRHPLIRHVNSTDERASAHRDNWENSGQKSTSEQCTKRWIKRQWVWGAVDPSLRCVTCKSDQGTTFSQTQQPVALVAKQNFFKAVFNIVLFHCRCSVFWKVSQWVLYLWRAAESQDLLGLTLEELLYSTCCYSKHVPILLDEKCSEYKVFFDSINKK